MPTTGPSSPSFWDSVYQSGRAPWDLGAPTPVFQRLIRSGQYPPGKIIVLGAGRGHDAREFARHSFTVTAIDFAAEAVQAMRDLAEPDAPINALQADIFELPHTFDAMFDYALDYTCYCAIDPARREEYADVVTCVVKPGGAYIHLAFPIDEHKGGPPFAVSPDQIIALFETRGFELQQRESPPDSARGRRGKEELLIFCKR